MALESAFPPTRPPPSEADLYTLEWLKTLGASSIQSAIVESTSGFLSANWYVDEHGETNVNEVGMPTVKFPMGTIDELRTSPTVNTVVRCVNPRRWELAWRLPGGRIYVASVRYRRPRTTLDEDSNLEQLKLLCESNLATANNEAPDLIEPPAAHLLMEAPFIRERRTSPRGAKTPVAPDRRSRDTVGPSPAPHSLLRWPVVLLMLFSFAVTVVFFLCGWQASILQAELLSHRLQIESTLTSRLDEKLAQGDYGEVQAELDSLQALEYFDGAVVTNLQQRVIAQVGRVPGVRIGDPVPLAVSATAKVFPLGAPNQRGSGQAMTWGPPDVHGVLLSLLRQLLIFGAGLSTVAVLVAIWLLTLLRRRRVASV